jgi:hypothetical protein
MRRAIWLGVAALSLLGAAPAIAGAVPAKDMSAADQAAIFKAAGFKAKGDKWVRCEDDTTQSAMTGFIEVEDLNGDGVNEAWVRESSLFCYGNTAEAFVLVGKDAKGAWSILLDQVGMGLALDTKSKSGWKDIEVGGPGMGPFPKYRYDGTKYVHKKK